MSPCLQYRFPLISCSKGFKRDNCAPFSEVAWIVIYAVFCLFLGTKRCFKYICVALRCVLGSTIKQRKWFSCLQYKILLNSYSKGLILTNFRRRMDRHLRVILWISRNETVLRIYLRSATMKS